MGNTFSMAFGVLVKKYSSSGLKKQRKCGLWSLCLNSVSQRIETYRNVFLEVLLPPAYVTRNVS